MLRLRAIRDVRPEDLFTDGQGPLIVGPGPGRVPLGPEEDAQIVEAAGGIRMLRPEDLFPDGQGPLNSRAWPRHSPWAGESAQIAQAAGGIRMLGPSTFSLMARPAPSKASLLQIAHVRLNIPPFRVKSHAVSRAVLSVLPT